MPTRRILSLAPSNTEILYALGAGDRLVGATVHCDYPAEAETLPKIGSWIYGHDLTQFDALAPDFIVTSMYLPPLVQRWATNRHVPLLHVNPQTIEGIYKSISVIGRAVDLETAAKKLVRAMRTQEQDVRHLGKLNNQIRIYGEEFQKPPTVSANWVPELIEAAGGVAMVAPGQYSRETSAEEVAAFDPDLVVLHWCGAGDRPTARMIQERPGWDVVPAVRDGRIATIHDTFLNRPGPRIWEGARMLHRVVSERLAG